MKNIERLIIIIALAVSISLTAYAQQKQGASSDSTQNLTLKDKWTKHYNEINTKLNEYLAKLKSDGSNHKDFTDAVDKLDKMLATFKDEIEKWDHATKDQRAKYSDALKQDFKNLKAQEEKVKNMWNKLNEEMKKNSEGHG